MTNHIRNQYRAGTSMINIGAHLVFAALHMRDILTKDTENAKIYAFESVFHALCQLNILNNNAANQIALYDVAFGMGKPPVTHITLDDFHIRDCSVIKIDVEGNVNV